MYVNYESNYHLYEDDISDIIKDIKSIEEFEGFINIMETTIFRRSINYKYWDIPQGMSNKLFTIIILKIIQLTPERTEIKINKIDMNKYRKDNGLCVLCGKESNNYTHCQECRNYLADSQYKHRQKINK